MLDYINRLLKNLSIKNQGNSVHVSGLPTYTFAADLQRIWGTQRIIKHMFSNMSSSGLTMLNFFLPDLIYMLGRMRQESGMRTSKRLIIRLTELLLEETWMKSTTVENPSILNFKKLENFNVKPFPYQMDFLNTYNTTVPAYRLQGYVLAAGAGAGKAQPLYSLVKVPGGWKRMGDMSVGDVVSTPDGKIANVIGVYPQGKRPVYRLTFQDGRQVDADYDHLWKVTVDDKDEGRDCKVTKLMRTHEILARIEARKGNPRIYVPLMQADPGVEIPSLLDPYLLGALIGDGTTGENAVHLSSADAFIVDEIRRLLPDDLDIKHASGYDYRITGLPGPSSNAVVSALRKMGLAGKRSWEKFIPQEYMGASVAQRLALLQGLMDTDGTVDAHSSASFCTTSERLAYQVQDLVRSLGWMAKISVKKSPKYVYNGEIRHGMDAYQVHIRSDKPSDLFRLPRKKERCNDDGQYCADLGLAIRTVEFIGEDFTQCIMIDHPDHLYITDNYTVTHNTLNFLMLAHCLEADTIIGLAPKNTMRAAWEKDLTKHVRDDKIKDAYWSDEHKVQDINRSDKYFFLHYEAIDQLVDVMKHRKRTSKRVVIAVDESHNLNDLSAARTRKLVEYVRLLRQNMVEVHVVFMSGTPIKQMGAEMIPCLNCIDPMFDRYAEERFRAIYGLTSSRANDILRARIGNMMHIVPREAYRKEKVKPIDVPVKIPNGKNYTLNSIRDLMAIYVSDRAKYYKDNMASFIATYEEGLRLYAATMRTPGERADFEKYKSFVAIIRKRYDPVAHKEMAMYCNAFEERRIMPVLPRDLKLRFKDAKSVVKYVALKIQGEALANVLGVARIRCHVDMLEHIDFDTYIDNAEGKTLIFSSYVPVVEKLTGMLSSAGFNPEPIYGATNKNINAILQRLEKDPDVNPAVATYDSLAEGVPMLMCNTELLLNAPWRSSDEIQAISRIDRVGQTLPVAVFRFYLDTGDEPNVSTRSQEIMELSRALVAEILGIEDSPKGAEATQMVLAMEGYSFEDEMPQTLIEEAFDAVPSTKSSYADW